MEIPILTQLNTKAQYIHKHIQAHMNGFGIEFFL